MGSSRGIKSHKVWNKNNPNNKIIKGDGNCIHHKDGDHDNNEWVNLRVVCVRCHSEHHRLGIELDVPILIKE